jgi:PrtD family type I secretion system ABC transporter
MSESNPAVQALRRSLPGLLFIAGISLLINLLLLTSSIYMMQVFDRVLTSGHLETLGFLTLIALIAIAVYAVLEGVRSGTLARIGSWLEAALAPLAFRRSLEPVVRPTAGADDRLGDLAAMRSFLGGPAVTALMDAPWTPVFLAFIWMLHPLLGAIAAGAALVLMGFAVVNDLATRRLTRKATDSLRASVRHADEMTRQREVIDALGIADRAARRFADARARAVKDQEASSRRGGMILAASKFIRLAVQIAVLAAGAWLVVNHEMTDGSMVAASIVLSRALAPLEQSIGSWRQATAALRAFRRLHNGFAAPRARTATMPVPVDAGHLSARNVGFAVPVPGTVELRPILRDISFDLAPGEALAVIGPSASGKSTLARLLVGILRPTTGNVRLAGADLFVQDRSHFGRHIGYLPQDVELFPGSVRDNIARLEDADPERIVAAARLAGVHDMILHLPQGYDTPIGPGIGLLSGGQRQRIGLARALFGSPRLVVLDEPNASLDSDGDAALSNAVAAIKTSGASVVVITHRMSMVTQMDRVLALRQGRIDLYGPRDRVLQEMRRRVAAVVPVARDGAA